MQFARTSLPPYQSRIQHTNPNRMSMTQGRSIPNASFPWPQSMDRNSDNNWAPTNDEELKRKRRRNRRACIFRRACCLLCLSLIVVFLLCALASILLELDLLTKTSSTSSTTVTTATTITTTTQTTTSTTSSSTSTSSSSTTSTSSTTATTSTTSQTTSTSSTSQTTTTSVTATSTTVSKCAMSGLGSLLTQNGPTNWFQFSYTYLATSTAPTLRFIFNNGPADYSYLDAVSVTDNNNASVELLSNPSFENSIPSPVSWTVTNSSTCQGSTQGLVTNSGCHSGSGSNCFLDHFIPDVDCGGLKMDSQGNLYVSDYVNNEIRKWSNEFAKGIIVAGGNGKGNQLNQLNYPIYFFVDKDESIYVSDHLNHRVMKWSKNAKEGIVVAGGQGQGNLLTQLRDSAGIVVDKSDNVYIVDAGNNRVVRWSKDSKKGEIIVGGNGKGEAANQFDYPTSLALDRQGDLYVADFRNHRIQKFLTNKN
ncbi:unnamed protein product [Adineta ricciae]|uniref:Uncharacterized protein n=2 Tax=Adineta ricciae TaxID=249248 RepID=A0A815AG22_ADIRI|nr:unnamed protein product [Adineta ricciae]